MRRTSFADMPCSVARTLEVIGEWWTMLVIREAFNGVRRFDDFQGKLGIARNVLAARLQGLVDNEVLERRQYQDRPPRYEYRLTPMGQGLQLAAALRLPTFRAADAEQHGRGEQDYTAVLAAILDGAAGRRAG